MALLPAALPALAFQEKTYSTQTFTFTYIIPEIQNYARTPEGGLAWDYLGRTAIEDNGDPLNPFAPGKGRPVFADELLAQDGKTVKMEGYMFPLADGEGQTRFLFGPFPMTCPYHYHVPQALVVHVDAINPIPFGYDAMVLEGQLHLQKDASEPLYRIRHAKLVSAPHQASQKSWHPLFRSRPPVGASAPTAPE